MVLDVPVLTGTPRPVAPPFLIRRAESPAQLDAYRRLRRDAFVDEQGLFAGSDLDDIDDDPRTVVLVAMDASGRVLGGVRLAPALRSPRDLGWWAGGRLVVAPSARSGAGIGAALVRAACAHAEASGVLRFDATVQPQNQPLFDRLGWIELGHVTVAGADHVHMHWPIDRIQRQANASKAFLRALLDGQFGGAGFVGDDGAPIAGTDVIAACDAILPSLVERDPEWAGWCAVLVNVNDLSAMGAAPVGLFDALGARDASFASRVFSGLRSGAEAWGIPILGGHTQLGVPASLSVTALGRTVNPIPGGGGEIGHALTLTADLSGGWRPGYTGAQWDSTSHRSAAELQSMAGMVANAFPAAAKDVSMAGLVGTVGMLAEASGCGAVLDVSDIPTPESAGTADWLTCFPGFGMITADPRGDSRMASTLTTSVECGELVTAPGVQLRWPDGIETTAVSGPVTGLGKA